MTIKIPKTTFEIFETGTYSAEIKGIERDLGKYGDQVKFTFRLLDVGSDDSTLLAWASAKYNPKTKLWRWTKAALGKDFNPSDDFNSSQLLGRKVVLVVSRRYGENGEFNKVDDVLHTDNSQISAQSSPESASINVPEAPPNWIE